MKYSFIKRRMSRDNHGNVCREPGKMVDGMEFLEAEEILRVPKDIIQLERHFALRNYILMLDDEDIEVTAV